MSDSPDPPGFLQAFFLLLLAAGAIFCGTQAIISESSTTPSMHGDTIRVHGNNTLFLGFGWLLIGIGFISKVILSRLHFSKERWITLGMIITGGMLWLFVFL